MEYISAMSTNVIYILFPILCYFFYAILIHNKGSKINEVFLDIALVISLYLIISAGENIMGVKPLILFNIPLLAAYLLNRKTTALFLSFIIVTYYVNVHDFNIYLMFSEYLIYYLLYFYVSKKSLTKDYLLNSFIIIKAFIFSFECVIIMEGSFTNSEILFNSFSSMIIFYLVSQVILMLILKVEHISNLYVTFDDLKKDNELQKSLFRITHEIKNPIAVCKGYLDMFDVNKKKHAREYIPIIKSEIDRTLTLIEDFSNYKKIEIKKEILDINLLVEEVLKTMRVLFDEKGIKINLYESNDEIFIEGDYNRLKQVLINILKNSVEAIDEDGKIDIDLYAEEDLKIIIKDNGCGMSSVTLERLGEIFYTTKICGTGLGVNLSKEIIDRHDGEVLYESASGEGTTVSISLPINEKYN